MKCNISKQCGACAYCDVPYEKEIEKKNKSIKELYFDIGHVEPILLTGHDLFYRYKVTGVLAYKKGKIYSGVYRAGTHEVIENYGCLIEDEGAAKIIKDTAKLMGEFKFRVYNEDTGRGDFRYLQVRVSNSHASKQYMLTIVTSGAFSPAKNNFIKALRVIHPEIDTIVQNINDRTDNMILSDREKILFGKGYIEDELLERRFRISSQSFYQVNGYQTAKLYQTAIDMLKLKDSERVLDAYCGTGTIGLVAAGKAKEVVGVEINPMAVRDAKTNAQLNKIKNIKFHVKDAGDYLESISEKDVFDAVIMDPPRSGSTKKFLKALMRHAPKKIVYIACGPESQVRDLKVLRRDYDIKRIQPVDMFSKTMHVEVVCLLVKKDNIKQ